MRWLRSHLFDLFLFLWTCLIGSAIPVYWIAGIRGARVRRFSRVWVRGVLAGLRWIVGIQYREQGRENIPPGPCLFIGNHQSPWEALTAPGLLPDVAIVTKRELARIPAIGFVLKTSPMILIDREAGQTSLTRMVAEGKAAIADGRSVLIFPEGTRRPVAAPIEFRRGFELLYRSLRVPVVPFAVNAGLFWGPQQKIRRPGMITISFLPPIPHGLAARDLHEQLRDRIQRERDRLVSEGRTRLG